MFCNGIAKHISNLDLLLIELKEEHLVNTADPLVINAQTALQDNPDNISFAELISNSISFSFLQFSLFLILGALEPGIEECDLVSRSEELYTELVGKKTAEDVAGSYP